MRKKTLVKLLKKEMELTRSALDLLHRAYTKDEGDNAPAPADDESPPDPRHLGYLLPQHTKPTKAYKREVEPEPVFLRFYQ